MSVVFAKQDAVLADANGLPFRLQAGQPWEADDPLVKRHAWAFASEPLPEHVQHSLLDLPGGLRPKRAVEQATREPGEVRAGRAT